MADTEQVRDAGRRLASDLRDLRDARKLTSEMIAEATRLSSDVLENFEESALVDHPAYNRVYLRSVMASYARVLEIEERHALKALEEALAGNYSGSLRRKYISGSGVDTDAEIASLDKKNDALATVVEEEAPLQFLDADNPSGVDFNADERNIDAVDGLIPDEPDASRRGSSAWKVAVPILLIAGALATIFLVNGPDPVPRSSVDGPAIVDETLPQPEPDWIVLGDSVRIDIVAALELLDPIRVKLDGDMRRPYWIELLDTLTFFMRNEVMLERELLAADIYIEGYLLADSLIDEDGRIVLSKAQAQAYLDEIAIQNASRN